MSRPAWSAFLRFVLPHVTGMTSMGHFPQPLIEVGVSQFLPGLVLNCDLPVSASRVAGITGLNHLNSPFYILFFFPVSGLYPTSTKSKSLEMESENW
jgi:hypothetical protein